MAMKRVNILWTVLSLVGGLALGAWVAGHAIQSPAEVAARTAPPQPSPILVPVEQRVLSSDVVTRGTIRFGLPQPVTIAPSILKGGPGLIATLPVANTPFQEGDVLLTASGRPVFLLQGANPGYRDISPGTSGADVRQLEAALARLGFDPGAVDGTYDRQTADAVARWYRAKGWEPFGPTRDQATALRTVERDWSDAARAQLAAETALASAAQSVAAARALAEQNYRQSALDSAARADDRRRLAQAGTGRSDAVETERARAQHAEKSADADLAAQIAEQAIVALDPRQTDTARAAAAAKLELARAARRKAQLEGEQAIHTAEREGALAAERVRHSEAAMRSVRMEGERSVRAALDQQKLAEFDLRTTRERAALLAADLAETRRKVGIQVPADEVVFLPALPVRVHEVTAAIAANAAGPVLSVTDNQLSVDSQLPLDAAPLVKPGMQVAIDEQALGVKAAGVVEVVASTPGTRGVDGYHFYLGVKVVSTPMRLEGFSVRLTIPLEATKGAVTAVPVSALSLAADGTSRVQVERGGRLEFVTVQPGLSAGGYVEVASADGQLQPGQRIVVGYKTQESGL